MKYGSAIRNHASKLFRYGPDLGVLRGDNNNFRGYICVRRERADGGWRNADPAGEFRNRLATIEYIVDRKAVSAECQGEGSADASGATMEMLCIPSNINEIKLA